MDADKFKLRLDNTDGYLTIPISLESTPIDQSELIDRDFVAIEMEKAVNPIIDYEMSRFTPVNNNSIILNRLVYNLTFKTGSHFDDIGFVSQDIIFNRNNFKRSFLSLDFYDSNDITNQNYLSRLTLFCRVRNDYYGVNNTLKDISQLEVKFTVENPIIIPSGITEGFYLYDYKNEVPKDIYMRATFNNAKTGKSTKLMCSSSAINGKDMGEKTHIKFSLFKANDGYYYKPDYTLSNIQYNTLLNSTIINLFEIDVI